MHENYIDDELTNKEKVLILLAKIEAKYKGNQITYSLFISEIDRVNQEFGTSIKYRN